MCVADGGHFRAPVDDTLHYLPPFSLFSLALSLPPTMATAPFSVEEVDPKYEFDALQVMPVPRRISH
jgi:hypothetical protein